MKAKSTFATITIMAISLCSLQKTNAQWGLPGNANANANSKLGATAAGVPLRIFAGNANMPKIYINGNTGNVGIGTGNVAPAGYKLQVTGGDNFSGTYSSGTLFGVYGSSTNGWGLYGNSGWIGVQGAGNTYGVYGYSNGGYGVYGNSDYSGVYGNGNTYGVYGYSNSGSAVKGYGNDGYGGDFYSAHGFALRAESNDEFFAGVFYGSLWTTGSYEPSDKNLKKNIQEFGSAMSIINKLNPKNYEFRTDEKFASLKLPKGVHYGLIAQELEKVLPNLVHQDSLELNITKPQGIKSEDRKELTTDTRQEVAKETINIKGVNNTELIPIMIKAIQEQDARIEALTQLVSKLSQDRSASKSSQNANAAASVKLTSAFLDQNAPNPLSNSTRISYNIPAGVAKAQLIINDNNGKTVKQIQLTSKGNGVVTIDASALSSGTYNYLLLIDGKLIESKMMVVAH